MHQSHSTARPARTDAAPSRNRRTTWVGFAGGVLALALIAGACSGEQSSSLPDDADPQLQTGERIWLQRCANCHGLEGGGGIGPKLGDGEVAKKYPDPTVEKSIIQNGYNQMPPFKDILSDEDIDAVMSYTRDAL